MVFYGRWVTSYCSGDAVQVLSKDTGKICIGQLFFSGEFMGSDWYVLTKKNDIFTKEDILVLSPFDYWYRDNSDKLYDSFLEYWLRVERPFRGNLRYNYDSVEPLPPRITTEGYQPSKKELDDVVLEQKKLGEAK